MFRDDSNTHSVEIVINGLFNMHEEEQIRLKVTGDGSLEYFVDTMKAALIAFGYTPSTVSKIGFIEPGEEE